ncbi:DUF4190 domain-containing protein [Calidifontibacter indicus]|uniref:DUF4190 domain-containing protein n=1 Tax=Calidifontibacter indicus TaxID=419650 RepID=UPI003D74B38B
MSNYGQNDPNQPYDPNNSGGNDPYGQQGQQGQQPQYGHQYGQQGYGAAPSYDPNTPGGYAGAGPAQESKKAQTALYLSIGGICCGLLSIAGIVMGVQAKTEIKNSGGQLTGDSKAQAAIIIGSVFLVLGVIGNILYWMSR